MPIGSISKSLKALFFLLLVGCIGGFIYFSISVGVPVLKVNEHAGIGQKPSIRVFFRVDHNMMLQSGVRASTLAVHYRFGGHNGFNPLYTTARNLFDKTRKFAFCIDGVKKSFPLKEDHSGDWWYERGREYYLDEEEFLRRLPKHRIIKEALLIEGDCAENYDDNTSIAGYDIYYLMPKLDSYYDQKFPHTTFDQARQEATKRTKNDAGYTQLSTAIANNALDAVKVLVTSGASVNGPVLGDQDKKDPHLRPPKFRPSPLKIALSKGHDEIAEYLLQQGAKDGL